MEHAICICPFPVAAYRGQDKGAKGESGHFVDIPEVFFETPCPGSAPGSFFSQSAETPRGGNPYIM